ncbi:MAG: hypothetical protein LBL04_05460 [Bacteroidales bacterium]|nr:hypothetical protein [Bacteroidales bacterium]
MKAKDFIPQAFAKLLTWLTNFITYLNLPDVMMRLGLDMTRVSALSAEIDEYREACVKAGASNAGSVDRLDRREKAKSVTKSVRNFVNASLRYNEAVTDDDRKQLGLTIPDSTPTSDTEPLEYPEIEVDTSVLRRISCRFLNREHRISKPHHVHGTELRSGFIPDGEKPSLTHLVTSSFSTRSSITLDFTDEQRGKPVGFCARYENNTGAKGPFGPIVTVFVP